MVSGLTFESELIFVNDVIYGSSFILTCEYPVISAPFIEQIIFSPLSILPCQILVNYIWLDLFLGSLLFLWSI